MAVRKGTKSPNRGQLKAAGGRDPAVFYRELIARLRTHVEAHGTRVGNGDFYHVEMSASAVFRDDFGLGGSHVRAIQVLQRVRIMVIVSGGVAGATAKRLGKGRSTVWAVNMTRNPEAREFMEATEAIYQDQEKERQRKRREDRLAGDTPETTSGGPVTTRHEHREPLEHEHNGIRKAHWHERAWTPTDGAAAIHWIEFRHHTHPAKPEPPERVNGTVPAAVAREVTEELAGGKPAMLARTRRAPAKREGETASEGRHRRLMELVVELEQAKAELEQENATLRQQKASLEELLETATDPTESEAEAFLSERGK